MSRLSLAAASLTPFIQRMRRAVHSAAGGGPLSPSRAAPRGASRVDASAQTLVRASHVLEVCIPSRISPIMAMKLAIRFRAAAVIQAAWRRSVSVRAAVTPLDLTMGLGVVSSQKGPCIYSPAREVAALMPLDLTMGLGVVSSQKGPCIVSPAREVIAGTPSDLTFAAQGPPISACEQNADAEQDNFPIGDGGKLEADVSPPSSRRTLAARPCVPSLALPQLAAQAIAAAGADDGDGGLGGGGGPYPPLDHAISACNLAVEEGAAGYKEPDPEAVALGTVSAQKGPCIYSPACDVAALTPLEMTMGLGVVSSQKGPCIVSPAREVIAETPLDSTIAAQDPPISACEQNADAEQDNSPIDNGGKLEGAVCEQRELCADGPKISACFDNSPIDDGGKIEDAVCEKKVLSADSPKISACFLAVEDGAAGCSEPDPEFDNQADAGEGQARSARLISGGSLEAGASAEGGTRKAKKTKRQRRAAKAAAAAAVVDDVAPAAEPCAAQAAAVAAVGETAGAAAAARPTAGTARCDFCGERGHSIRQCLEAQQVVAGWQLAEQQRREQRRVLDASTAACRARIAESMRQAEVTRSAIAAIAKCAGHERDPG